MSKRAGGESPSDDLLSLAGAPDTPPEVLRRLDWKAAPRLGKALAQNPNTPADLLLGKLAERFPVEVLQNPVFPLLFLENPGVLDEITPRILHGMIQHPRAPRALLEWAAAHPDKLRRAWVADNPAVPEDLLVRLASDEEPVVRASVARSRNAPQELLRRLAADGEEMVRLEVAKNPSTPSGALRRLSKWTSFERVSRVALANLKRHRR